MVSPSETQVLAGVAAGAFAALALPVGYFVWIYTLYRRPPRTGLAEMAEYDPPEGIAPAEAAYLLDGTLKARALAATFVDLALRGVIAIDEDPDGVAGFRLMDGGRPMEEYESLLLDIVFGDGDAATFAETDERLNARWRAFREAVIRSLGDEGILSSDKDPARIVVFSAAAMAALIAHLQLFPYIGFIAAAVSFLVYVALLQMAYIAVSWRPQLTAKGREMLWRVIGFRRYLVGAEAGRIRWEEAEKGIHPMTPYAIVFGITLTWATKLQEITDDLVEKMSE